mmetsp:Transcript_36841/g.98103  ORF Transcript_36841/g.98103 Transcript_36841/m.98103 type:complete len:233 (+) Transcript_36841:454-1152(+)
MDGLGFSPLRPLGHRCGHFREYVLECHQPLGQVDQGLGYHGLPSGPRHGRHHWAAPNIETESRVALLVHPHVHAIWRLRLRFLRSPSRGYRAQTAAPGKDVSGMEKGARAYDRLLHCKVCVQHGDGEHTWMVRRLQRTVSSVLVTQERRTFDEQRPILCVDLRGGVVGRWHQSPCRLLVQPQHFTAERRAAHTCHRVQCRWLRSGGLHHRCGHDSCRFLGLLGQWAWVCRLN